MTNGIEKVAANALKHFAPVLHPQAIRIFTPFTDPVPLDSCKLSPDLKRFLVAYEPKLEQSGLFPHQADFLNAYGKAATRTSSSRPRQDREKASASGPGSLTASARSPTLPRFSVSRRRP